MPSSKLKTKPASSQTEPQRQCSFEAIGTQWWIGVYEHVAAKQWLQLQQKTADCIETFDKRYSRFRDDSWVMQIAKQSGSYKLPPDAAPLLKLYDRLYQLTDGAVTPLIGQALEDAGYDASYSLQPKPMRAVSAWHDACKIAGNTLTTGQPQLLDFGAAGKGYLVDQLVTLLRAGGIRSFCVDGSGDLYCVGVQLSVGLENPDNTSQVIGVVPVGNAALCASAPNRRSWTGYHHIMNPHTLSSPQHIKAVWVVADSAMVADGLTTALFFVDPLKLQPAFDFAWAILSADGKLRRSPNFTAELFIKEHHA